MANVVKCFKDARKRDQAALARDADGKSNVQETAQETWRVVYDGIVEQLAVFSAAGLPQVGKLYGPLLCTRVNPIRSTENPNVWDVVIDYANRQPQTTQSGNWSINLRRSVASREETALVDRTGAPLINTAGELLPQLPNIALFDEVLTVTWSTNTVPSWADSTLEGRVNSDAVNFTICGITRSFAANQMKCVGIGLNCTRTLTGMTGTGPTATPIYRYQYDCELSFQIRKPKWYWRAPNEGYRGNITAGDTTKMDLFRDGGIARTSPTRMDQNGFEKTDDGYLILPDDVPSYSSVAGRFRLEDEAAFSGLFTGLNDSDQLPPQNNP